MKCIPKRIALYSPIPPPPLVWIYTCEHCMYFVEIDKCSKVCGDIARGAWCVIWTPRIDDKPFSWISNMLPM